MVSDNKNLTTLIVNATVPPVAEVSWMNFVSDNDKLSAIYVPDESVEAYKIADGWKKNAEIIKSIIDMP